MLLLFRFIGGSDASQLKGSVTISDVTVSGGMPTATFSNNGPVNEGSPATFLFSNQVDAAGLSTSSGFTYSYDFYNNGKFTDPGDFANVSNASAAFTFNQEGTYTVVGRIEDQYGQYTDYTSTITVNEAPLTLTLQPPSPVEGMALNNVLLATFTDGDPATTRN